MLLSVLGVLLIFTMVLSKKKKQNKRKQKKHVLLFLFHETDMYHSESV